MREKEGAEVNMCEKREREKEGDCDRSIDQSKCVKEALRLRGRTRHCYALGDKVKEKMKMYSLADAINQE